MNFRIEPGLPLDGEIRRIAADQIDKAIAELTDPGDRHEAVHDVRKRFKKLRALVRLTRTADETFYRTENARYRDAGRALSSVRDRTALIESLDALEAHFEDEVATDAFAPVRAALTARRDAALEAEGDLGAAIAATLASLSDSRDAVGMLAFRQPLKRAAALVGTGYARTHRDAGRALREAERTHRSEPFHVLRKHAKYHAAHLGLLSALWPAAMRPQREAATAIGDDLGQDHDYAVFRAEVAADPEAFGERRHLDVVLALMDRRQAELRQRSLAAARRLFAERPEAAGTRIMALFRQLAETRRRPAATPADLPEEAELRAAE